MGQDKGTAPETARSPPTLGKMEKRREEARKLEEVGWSPGSSPTRQLAQMVAEAGPWEPARKKLCLMVGGKAPCKEFLKAAQLKEAPKVPARDSNPLQDPQVPEEHWVPQTQVLLLTSGPWNHPGSREVWPALPGAYGHGSAGSCRVLFDWPPGRCQPLCNPHKMHYNNTQEYPTHPSHLWRVPPLLSSSSSPKSVSVFLLFVDCVWFSSIREGKIIGGQYFTKC